MKFQLLVAFALICLVQSKSISKVEEDGPKEVDKRFWGMYGLGGMYGMGMGMGYGMGYGLWGKRDAFDTEDEKKITLTETELKEKRHSLMSNLMKAERAYYDLDESATEEEKTKVEKRFWGMYGGMGGMYGMGMGMGMGYPYGMGLWGKRDVADDKYVDVHEHGHEHVNEQEHLEHDHPRVRRDAEEVDDDEEVEVDDEEVKVDDETTDDEVAEKDKRFWGMYGLGGMYGMGMGMGMGYPFWGKRDAATIDGDDKKITFTEEEMKEKRHNLMTRLFEAESEYYNLSDDATEEKKTEVEKRFWGMYGGMYGMGMGMGYPYGMGLWGKRNVE